MLRYIVCCWQEGPREGSPTGTFLSTSDPHPPAPRHETCNGPVPPVAVQTVREVVQAVIHSLHTPADPLGHATLPMPVLWQTLPPEVRHEEAHLHPHRWVIFVFMGWGEDRRNAMWRGRATASAPRQGSIANNLHATVLWQPEDDFRLTKWVLRGTRTQAHIKISSWWSPLSSSQGLGYHLRFVCMSAYYSYWRRVANSFRTRTLLATEKSL